jgi:hypothetical protein
MPRLPAGSLPGGGAMIALLRAGWEACAVLLGIACGSMSGLFGGTNTGEDREQWRL